MSTAERRVVNRCEPTLTPPVAAGRKPRAPFSVTDGILALQAAAGNRATTFLVRQAAGSVARLSAGRPHAAAAPTLTGPQRREPDLLGSPTTDHHGPAVRTEVSGRRLAVQRDLKSVEKELKRRFADPNDPGLLARRAALSEQVGRLDEKDSSELVTELLQAMGNNVFTDRFQTLSASTRFELLTKLFGRLEHLSAEFLFEPLTSVTDELGFQVRFKQLVPEPRQRKELLATLSSRFSARHRNAPPSSIWKVADTLYKLWVNWEKANFRTSGGFSPDNDAQRSARQLGFSQLGVQPDPKSGQNVMELRGDVVNHTEGTVYDIKQTIEKREWKLIGRQWVEVPDQALAAGKDDDTLGDSDEDLTPEPSHPHLYIYDGPGIVPDPTAIDLNAIGYAYSASFVDWVIAKKAGAAGWERVSDDIEWHTNTTMKKVNGQWLRDLTGRNNIDYGSQPIIAP